MAQGTPKTAKAAPAGKRASAAQGSTPNKSPANKADKATASATKAAPSSASQTASSKKRVRLAGDGEATAVAGGAGDEATPSKGSSKKAKSSPAAAKANGAKREEEEATPSQAGATPVKSAMKKQKKAAAGEEDAAAEEATASKKKGKGKGKKAEAVVAADEVKLAEVGEDDAEEEEDDEEEIDFLEGFESGDDDGEDSSDEEAEEDEAQKPAFDMKQLPKVKGESVQKKLATKEKKQAKTGTVYLGRIPKGFYEEEMRSYFSQFGEVTRLRLSRNKQTGASKHYAFIEFKYASVAQIVQETMDNYLLLGHILVCKIVPDDQIHPKLWVGANRKFRVVPKARKDAARRNKPKTDEQKEKIKKRLLSREDKKRKQLSDLGIEYSFDGYRNSGKEVEEAKAEEAVPKPTPKKKGRKSGGGDEPAKKKARKST
ncbi:hypothetical protein JCM8202_000758 [Rhodotorula sphaerocarpa]